MFSSLRVAISVRNTLRDNFDIGAKAYSDTELVEYINRALPFIVSLDSAASIKTDEIPIGEGAYQTLPDDGVRLIKVFSNYLPNFKERIDSRTYSGTQAIKVMALSTLTAQNPDWAGAKPSTIVTTLVFNKDDPRAFIVYPPNTGEGKIMATISYLPKPVETIGEPPAAATEIALHERYFNAVVYHVIFSCLSRDGEDQSRSARASEFYSYAVQEIKGIVVNDVADTEEETAKV